MKTVGEDVQSGLKTGTQVVILFKFLSRIKKGMSTLLYYQYTSIGSMGQENYFLWANFW